MTAHHSSPVEAIDEHFLTTVSSLPDRTDYATPRGGQQAVDQLLQLFDAQVGSRHADLMARQLGKQGKGFYSIGSSGHESNAAVAAALRPTDPALLHYRSGAFYLYRAQQAKHKDGLLDILLGIVASADEPISGGRHKVFGHGDLAIIPQTSTIASHLPRAMGLAFSLARANKLTPNCEWPSDSVVVSSFGDASANHSTAIGAINTALHCSHQGIPMPLLLVCEDNGIGISVRTPQKWIASMFRQRTDLPYFTVDGHNSQRCLETSRHAANWVRTNRAPALLHLRTVRLLGHAGSDVESAYRSRDEITDDYQRDPLIATARSLISEGILAPEEIIKTYEEKRHQVAELAKLALRRPRLRSASEVMAAIATNHPDAIARRTRTWPEPSRRETAFGEQLPENQGPLTLAQAINRSLTDELCRDKSVLVFGQDVARKGGVYGVTRGLRKQFGGTRVFDTLLDEQSILGTALGAGLSGLIPIPEIQYLSYVHNAVDQLRGEASTLQFFSNGRYRNPMVVRIAGYGYQKGFGGHFHNDNSVAALLDMPGVIVASPSRPDDAAAMLRTCVAAAREDGRVSLFLEPIALYHTKDLHDAGDAGWLAPYPDPGSPETFVPVGSARLYGSGDQLTFITFGNGLPMSLRTAKRLSQRGIQCRTLDLRWLSPLPVDDILAAAHATGRVLVVDETRSSGGVSERVLATLVDGHFRGDVQRVTSQDSFIPLGEAANHVLLDEGRIEKAALDMLGL